MTVLCVSVEVSELERFYDWLDEHYPTWTLYRKSKEESEIERQLILNTNETLGSEMGWRNSHVTCFLEIQDPNVLMLFKLSWPNVRELVKIIHKEIELGR